MINFFDPSYEFLKFKKEYIKIFSKVINSKKYILDKETLNFEKNFAKFIGVKYAVGVNSATDGLTLALKVLNIDKGDEIITTPHTALATIAAIIDTGATPVLVDIETDTYCIDPDKIEKNINYKTKAIMPVHIYGHPANMSKIKNISKKYKIPIIEDCSQSFGSMINSQYVGSFGLLSVFSFYPTKNLGAIGDGGIIVTNSKKYSNLLRQIRQYGWNNKRVTKSKGANSRLDEIQAAILNYKLKHFKSMLSKKVKLVEVYNENIKNYEIIKPKIQENYTHSYHLYVIRSKKRKKLINYLNSNQIQSSIHYKNDIVNDKIYKKFCRFNKNDLGNFLKLNKQFLSLPLNLNLKIKEIKFISSVINRFV